MKFIIESGVFETLPNVCAGVVAAKGIDNTRPYPAIEALLNLAIADAERRFAGRKVKEDADIVPYREAFRQLGFNPNKYMCSIEALFTRIAKGKGMPHINPLVDLNNAVSLKYTLPMGTHDLGVSAADVKMRFARADDVFVPFGETEQESPDAGELIYAVGGQVRTRRWTWRQSEQGKIGMESSSVFFPIDGFVGFNDNRVREAAADLLQKLTSLFGCRAKAGFVCRECPEMDLDPD